MGAVVWDRGEALKCMLTLMSVSAMQVLHLAKMAARVFS